MLLGQIRTNFAVSSLNAIFEMAFQNCNSFARTFTHNNKTDEQKGETKEIL